MENNSRLKQVLLVFKRNAEHGNTFNSKVASLRGMRKKNIITLQIINKQINAIKTYLPPDPPLFVCIR